MTFEQYVIERFGKSVYQIELEIAMHEFMSGSTPNKSWERAHEFTGAMKEEASNGRVVE